MFLTGDYGTAMRTKADEHDIVLVV